MNTVQGSVERLDGMLREAFLRTHMILSSAVMEAATSPEGDLHTAEQKDLHERSHRLLLQSLEAMRELVAGIEPCLEVALVAVEQAAKRD